MNRIDNIPSKVAIWLQPSLTPHRNPIRVGHLHFLSYIASLQTQSLAVLAICMHADNLIHALLLQRKQHQGSNHALLPHEIAISMKYGVGLAKKKNPIAFILKKISDLS
ncbi:hypothetical protein AAC387_Pa03g1305 [Persea americana]